MSTIVAPSLCHRVCFEFSILTKKTQNFAMPVAYHPVEKAREQGVSFCETLETTELWMKSMYQNLVLVSKLILIST